MKLKTVISIAVLLGALWWVFDNFDTAKLLSIYAILDFRAVLFATAAILISSLFAALRIRSIAADFGYPLSLRDAFATLSLGQIGGALFFQIFGQVAARSSYLKDRHVPFAGTILITTQERIAAALVSALLATIGVLYVFRQVTFDLVAGRDMIRIIIGLIAVFITCGWLWRRELFSFFMTFTASDVLRAVRSVAFSAAVQLCTMLAYVSIGAALAPDVHLLDLTAASTLVMFAASVPISFAGWGVREMSAVAALGAIGMANDHALTVAVTIGALSILCAAFVAVLSAGFIAGNKQSITEIRPHIASRSEELFNAALPVLTAMLVFFHLHAPTYSGTLNVNLADPLAIIAGVIFLLNAHRSPFTWRVRGVSLYIFLCTAAFTLALFVGALHVGWTEWAVTNKYLGWFVLLGFAAAGAMGARIGIDHLLRTFTFAGGTILALQILSVILTNIGIIEPTFMSGFAQNNNAFAFQCLMLLAVVLAQSRRSALLIAFALTCIVLTGSRAGLGAAAIVLLTAAIYIPDSWREIGTGIVIALILCVGLSPAGALVPILASRDASDHEHYQSMIDGLRLFLAHPLFGAGLGTFISQWNGPRPLQIHSTTIWLLAEFGIVGFVAFLFPVVRVFAREAAAFRRNDVAGNLLVLIIAGLSAMSLFHELLYQRTFWLLLGAALATLPKKSTDDA